MQMFWSLMNCIIIPSDLIVVLVSVSTLYNVWGGNENEISALAMQKQAWAAHIWWFCL